MEKGKILNLLNELKENGKIKDYLGYGETYAIIERIMTVPGAGQSGSFSVMC